MQNIIQENKINSKSKPKPFVASTPIVQKKLTIGVSDDPYETEADRIADQVVRIQESTPLPPPTPPTTNSNNSIQRKCAHCEEEEHIQKKALVNSITPLIQKSTTTNNGTSIASQEITQKINNSRGSGSLMGNTTRNFMESRFGADFSDVRIHTDNNATKLSASLNAQAFTIGNDVYFNQGKYNPGSNEGKHLLAHELTHTIQQKGSIQKKIQLRSRGEALTFAQQLNTLYPNWLSVLPDCLCTYSQTMRQPTIWRDATHPLLQNYHPGATKDVRTRQGYSTVSGSHHGQQCTYDANGNLITEGAGAGTPDLWSPDDGLLGTNSTNHRRDDVEPFNLLGWRIYNQYWQPNKGSGCTDNAGGGRRVSSGRHQIIGVFSEIDLLIISIPLRTVRATDNVYVKETGRRRGGMVGGRGHYSLVEVIPDGPEAETLFGNNNPRFLPEYILTPIP